MVDPIKGCAEINQHDPSPMATLQCTLQCMHGTRTKVHHRYTQTFPISNWVVGSKPLRYLNLPRLTDTRRLNTLDNTDVMEIGCKLATEEDGGPFGICVTLAFLQQLRQETTQTYKPPKHYTKTRVQNISSSLKKKRKHTQWVSAPKDPTLTRDT